MNDTEDKVKYAGDPQRDLKIIKVCEVCKEKYHPRKNSYQMTSRFCSQECAKKGRRFTNYN